MKQSIPRLILIAAVTWPLLALPPAKNRILVQENSPVEITGYFARYNDEDGMIASQLQLQDSYEAVGSADAMAHAEKNDKFLHAGEGIAHVVEYRNITERKIVAVVFGLLAFDIFDESQDTLHGWSLDDLEPDVSENGTWTWSSSMAEAFHTGMAYVVKVRFEDGEIWKADLEDITKQIQGIDKDFSPDSLKLSEPAKGLLAV